jgi:TolB protein
MIRLVGPSGARRALPFFSVLAVAAGAATLLLTGLPVAAQGQRPAPAAASQARPSGPLEVDINQGTLKPIPIAIADFIGDDPKLAADISDVVSADLERSGLFAPIDRAAFVEQIRNPDQMPNMNSWRAVRADALAVGRVLRGPDGRVEVQFRLWDVATAKQLAGQRFAGVPAANWRRAGHLVADQIYERLTGEKGYFNTRVVFVDETGPKDKRIKRLAIMDQDGANIRLLSQGQELVMTPRFSPTSQEITFMSYAREQGRVFVMNLDNGQRELLGEFPQGTLTFAPRFSPDGQRIVFSKGEANTGSTSLFEMDLRSRRLRQLTDTQNIDTGPSYSPDGRQIVFESDRDGTQQLYVMFTEGGGTRRISNGDGRYSTPVWSPRGDLIAFTKQTGGRFQIGVMRPDGSGERILTDGYQQEGPTWAPNGRVLMFFRESPGARGGPKLFSIDLTGYNEREVKTPSFASDPAWSPLLN